MRFVERRVRYERDRGARYERRVRLNGRGYAPVRRKHFPDQSCTTFGFKATTPRINNIFESDDNVDLQNVLKHIALQYFSNDLSKVLATPTGSYDAGAALPRAENSSSSWRSSRSNEHGTSAASQKCLPTPSSTART